jgi:Na+(H+)/acetate symporter ActP
MVMLYSILGGITAVIWTDAIQGIILITGAVVCALILTFSMPQGPGQLFKIAAAGHKFSLGSFGPSLRESTFWVVLIYGLFINLQNYGIDQNEKFHQIVIDWVTDRLDGKYIHPAHTLIDLDIDLSITEILHHGFSNRGLQFFSNLFLYFETLEIRSSG